MPVPSPNLTVVQMSYIISKAKLPALESPMSRIRLLSANLLAGTAVLAILLLPGCGSDPDPAPSPTPAPTAIPVTTPTPTPDPTVAPLPTATPTPVPESALARKSLIPQGSTVIFFARPSEILKSSMVDSALSVLFAREVTAEGLFDELLSETGVSVGSLEFAEGYVDIGGALEMAIGGAGEPESGLPDLGIALRGAIDGDDLASRLTGAPEAEADQDYEVTNYRGFELYIDAQRDPGSLVFSVVEEDTLLVGTEEYVEAMLDVASGAASQISGEGVRALESLGDSDLGLLLAMPEELLDAKMGDGEGSDHPMAILGLGSLTPELTVMAVNFGDDSVNINTVEFYQDESVAFAAKEYSEGIIGMMGSLFGSAELEMLFSESVITHEGNRVSYVMSVDESAMASVLHFLISLMGFGAAPVQN